MIRSSNGSGAIRAQAASAALHSSVIVALRPSLPVLNCPFLIFSASSIPEIVTTHYRIA